MPFKKLLLISGIIVRLFALYPLFKYIFDYQQLSEYGQGYIWGKVFLLLFGLVLIGTSRFKRKAAK